jgi:hypothetical protein
LPAHGRVEVLMVVRRKVSVGYKATHAEYTKYVRPSQPCIPSHMRPDGKCSNCGWWKGEAYLPTLTDVQTLCNNCDLLNRVLAGKEARIFELERELSLLRLTRGGLV